MKFRFYTKPSKKRKGKKLYLDYCRSPYPSLTDNIEIATIYTSSSDLARIFMVGEKLGVKFEVEVIEEETKEIEPEPKSNWFSKVIKWLKK